MIWPYQGGAAGNASGPLFCFIPDPERQLSLFR